MPELKEIQEALIQVEQTLRALRASTSHLAWITSPVSDIYNEVFPRICEALEKVHEAVSLLSHVVETNNN